MAVVPRRAILQRFERVREAVSRSDRTLGHTVDSIHFHTAKLSDAVPMDRGSIVLEGVCKRDFQLIAPACLNPRTWEGLIEDFAVWVPEPICIQRHVSSIERVLA